MEEHLIDVLVRAQIGSVINLLEGGDGELKLGEQE